MILKQKAKGNLPLYQYRPKVVQNTSLNPTLQYFTVEKFEITNSFKTLENLGHGMFGSRLIAYDPIRMKYEEIKYDYYEKTADDVRETINQGTGTITTTPSVEQADDTQRVFSDFVSTDMSAIDSKPNKLISSKSDYVGSNNASVKLATTTHAHDAMFVAPPATTTRERVDEEGKFIDVEVKLSSTIGVTKKTFKDQGAKQNNVEKWLLQRQAQVSEFGNITVTFTVPGNTSRHVGDLIRFEVPSHIDAPPISQIGHQLYSGYYLISKIRHIIKKGENFEMDLELIKNSFAKRIPGQEPT
jgi:hypothetical protein